MRFIELRTDGGATRNASLMQFQSNILACPVLRSLNEELSAIGAAWLSGLALGWWKSLDEIEQISCISDRYGRRPSMRRNGSGFMSAGRTP